MNPEIYTHLFPKILDAGALDLFLTPIIMKKNRPANKLSVLCKEETVSSVETIIFEETTTLGIRKNRVEREELQREFEKVATIYGEITIKKAFRNGILLKFSPEFEECRMLANQHNIPLKRVFNEAMKVASEKFCE